MTARPGSWETRDVAHEDEQHVIDVLFRLLDEFLAEREASGRP